MRLINLTYDAIKYTLRNWNAVFLLGIVICISDTILEIKTDNLLIFVPLFIIYIILLLFEEGYRFKIITETLKGNNSPPNIGNLPKLLKEGFKELITILFYIALYYITYFIFLKIPNNDNFIPSIIFICITQTIILLIMGSPIYKSLNGYGFKSGFDIIGIIRLYYKIELVQLIIILIVQIITQNIIFHAVINTEILKTQHLFEFLLNFILAPILLLFETRIITLYIKESITS